MYIKLIRKTILPSFLITVFGWSQSNYWPTTINDFTYWQEMNGRSAETPDGGSGGIYPSGTAPVIYLDGILVGGYTDSNGDGMGDELHVSGSIYTNGMTNGAISDNGQLISDGKIHAFRSDITTYTAEDWRNAAKNYFFKSDTVRLDTFDNAGIIGISEYAEWPDSIILIDATTESHLAPSLSQTGMIWDNRAGAINQPFSARDYDRFDYWGWDDVIIDFGDSSLSWEYYSGWLHTDSSDAASATYGDPVYQPFAMYRVKPFGGDTIRLFAQFFDTNNDGHWSVNSEDDPDAPGELIYDWVTPTFGAEAWEPIYAVQGYNLDGTERSYDPDSIDAYIGYGAGKILGLDFYDGLALSSNSSWGNSPGEFVYPFVTATLFGAYYGPNEAGSYVDGSSAGGASSLPQVGNYDKAGAQLTVNHYFKLETSNDTSIVAYIDSSGLVTDAEIEFVEDLFLTKYSDGLNNWPIDLGAPFYDQNNNGIYELTDGDAPGFAGADETLWYVTNDADVGATASLYGTDPIGLEMQVTVFGYDDPVLSGGQSSLGQSVFKRLRIINKGEKNLTEAYISIWSDPDIGDYTNDFVGVDTSQNLMFGYNGVPDDGNYSDYGLAPAAVGYKMIHGPVQSSVGDTAIVGLKKVPDYKNLAVSSFGYFVAGGEYSDPSPYGDVTSAQRYYNLMRGFTPGIDLDNPTPWLDDTGAATKFPLAGDPVAGTGDLDSNPADRRMLMNVGPFEIAVGDTQEILLSISGGIADDYLGSVTALKNNASDAKGFMNSKIGIEDENSFEFNSISWYPGDTDHNGIVDASDIISIGMYFSRTNIQPISSGIGSLEWLERSQITLSSSLGNISMADVNSDGIVDEQDVVGIGVHWGNMYTIEGETTSLWNNEEVYNLSPDQKTGFEKLYQSLHGESEPIQEMRATLKTILGIGVPTEFSLQQNYPNPFNSGTTIKFSLPKPAIVNLSVYNVLGQIVDVPINNIPYQPGNFNLKYENNSLSSGVYFLRMGSGEWSAIKKTMLLK